MRTTFTGALGALMLITAACQAPISPQPGVSPEPSTPAASPSPDQPAPGPTPGPTPEPSAPAPSPSAPALSALSFRHVTVAAGRATGGGWQDKPATDAAFGHIHGLVDLGKGRLAFLDAGTAAPIGEFSELYEPPNNRSYRMMLPWSPATLKQPYGLVPSEGGYLVAESTLHRVVHVSADGSVRAVAGSGAQGFAGDGGPATAAKLNTPVSIAKAPDGSLYIAELNNHRLRRVRPDGVIETVLGTGEPDVGQLSSPNSVAVDQAGNVYVADARHLIRRLTPQGKVTVVAGSGTAGYNGSSAVATQTHLHSPDALAVGPDGLLYFADNGNYRIRRIGPAGLVETVIGSGQVSDATEGDPLKVMTGRVRAIAFSSDGDLHFAGQDTERIRTALVADKQ